MESPRLTQLLAMLKEMPNDSFLLFALAKEYEGMGEVEQALQRYRDLVAIDPNYVGTYYHLGKLLSRLEEFSAAFECYNAGMLVAKQQKDQHAYNELAGAKLELGDEDDFL